MNHHSDSSPYIDMMESEFNDFRKKTKEYLSNTI